jgi:O-antigen/teichoic acid export membrane protein
MKYLLLLLSVYSYAIGFLFANNPENDHPEVFYLLGSGLGTLLLIGALAVLLGEKRG